MPSNGLTCPLCNRTLSSPAELARHVATSHPAVPRSGPDARPSRPPHVSAAPPTRIPPPVSSPAAIATLHLWDDDGPGRDLCPGTREYRLFTTFPEFVATLDLPELCPSVLQLYAKLHVRISLVQYFALFDLHNYRFTAVTYSANSIDIAHGLYRDILDTQDDAQFHMLILSQLLELLHPTVPHPDTTTATLVQNPVLLRHAGTRGLIATQNSFIETHLRQHKIESSLLNCVTTSAMSAQDRDFLRNALLSDVNTAALCGVSDGNADAVLDMRLAVLARVYPHLHGPAFDGARAHGSLLNRLWDTYLPVSEWIIGQVLSRREAHPDEAYVLGLTGPQGSGKTTLNTILTLILNARHYKSVGFSLDDLYKTHAERRELKDSCKYYRFRGPPGTHDLQLGSRVMRELRQSGEGTVVRIPVFDKSLHKGDGDRLPETRWQRVEGRIDVVIFDGWCVGARPVDDAELDAPINDIEASDTYDDADGTFRRRINHALRDYASLFGECDDLVVLQVPTIGSIYRWRQLQETQLAATKGAAMEEGTVRRFVDYYMPTTERYMLPLAEDPEKGASLVLTLGDEHGVRQLKRFEPATGTNRDVAFLHSAAEERINELFRNPQRGVNRDLGTTVVIMDGVGLAPMDEENPLLHCSTPTLDMLASSAWPGALGSSWRPLPSDLTAGTPHPPPFMDGATVMGSAIHAASAELGLKEGQPGDSAVGHSSLAVAGYQRKYIGLIWEAIRNGSFARNDAISKPIEHVLEMRNRYAHSKLHIWGMCSRGYIHSDIEILFALMQLCAERGLHKEELVLHVVTDGKDVPKDTASEYVAELEAMCRQLGVGVIGTICGRDGWMCNRDRRFTKERNAPAARCVIYGEGVASDAPSALEAIQLAKEGTCGRQYGEDIDRFLDPTHIAGVQSKVESGDAMLCFNLREDRSVIFPQSFVFPLVDSGDLKDFLYATLIELRTLKRERPYHLVGFRQKEPGERAPLYLLRAGLVVSTFAESEKGNEVSSGYFGGHVGTIGKGMGALSVLIEVDPEAYPTSPTHPYDAPEMKAEEVTNLITQGMGGGVAILANLCNGDVIGHYGDKGATQISMGIVDRKIRRLLKEAQTKGVILMITADHGCAESWGPMHTANVVPLHIIFPGQHREMARGMIVGAGVKALTDVEPTRFMLLGAPQPEHMTGDSVLIPDVAQLSDSDVLYEVLIGAARNNLALLRRCPEKERMKAIMTRLHAFGDRQSVRMFVLRLHARLNLLRQVECPFLVEFLERIPDDLLPSGWATTHAHGVPSSGSPRAMADHR